MRYRQFQPSAAAARFVAAYWALEDAAGVSNVQRIVPDGRPELILNFGEPFQWLAGGRWERQPVRFLAGQLTGPMLVRPSGTASILGVRFHPDGASRALGVPAQELTGGVVEFERVAPTLARALRRIESIHDLPLLDAIFARLDAREDDLVSATLAAIVRTSGAIRIDDLACRIGLSRRQLERRFTAQVGLGPKLFCRIQRFQRVFQAIEGGRAPWADTAIACGYHDQAHLIRDFRDLAGEPPAALLLPEAGLATHFLANSGNSNSGGYFARE